MSPQPRPPAEVAVDEALVRALLAAQHPDLAALPVRRAEEGWDNSLFRLGDDLAVRLPRRALAVALLGHELRWLPELAPRLPLPVPVPVRAGRPGAGYPWPWSVVAWLPGVPLHAASVADPVAMGATLGGFVAALAAVPAPAEAPRSPYRGMPLSERDALLRQTVADLGDEIDGPALLGLWERLLATPVHQGPLRWLHGDLHPGNLLVHEGALSAVIDFGDLTAGDPATDLAVAWMLPPAAREAMRATVPADPATWQRARAWALALGAAHLASSADVEWHATLGRATLAAVL